MRMTKNADPGRRFYLRQARNAAGLTQEQLAERCGTTKGVISQLETGHTRYHEDWIEKLSSALQIEPAALFQAAPLPLDSQLRRVREAWPAIPQRNREALAALAESFRDEGAAKKTAS